MNILCVLFMAAIFLAIWHFFYDGIILPGYRQQLRNTLFEIRDELRIYLYEHDDDEKRKVAKIMHHSVNNFINKIHHLNIRNLARIKREIDRDEKLKQELREQVDVLNSCNDELLRNITSRLDAVYRKAFFANSGGWLIYIIPVAAAYLLFSKITSGIRYTAVLPYQRMSKMLSDMV